MLNGKPELLLLVTFTQRQTTDALGRTTVLTDCQVLRRLSSRFIDFRGVRSFVPLSEHCNDLSTYYRRPPVPFNPVQSRHQEEQGGPSTRGVEGYMPPA